MLSIVSYSGMNFRHKSQDDQLHIAFEPNKNLQLLSRMQLLFSLPSIVYGHSHLDEIQTGIFTYVNGKRKNNVILFLKIFLSRKNIIKMSIFRKL